MCPAFDDSINVLTTFLTASYFKDVEYAEIRLEDDQTESPPVANVYTESLYANYSCHQDAELAAEHGKCSQDVSLKSASRSEVNPKGICEEIKVTDPENDLVYSFAQLPKEQTEPTGQSATNKS